MASINEVTILGNLGRDPEVRYTQSGEAVATLNVATSKAWKGKDGEQHDRVEWHRVTVWGKSAEWLQANKRKGDQVLIRGHLSTRKWTDKDGNDRWATEVVASAWDRFGGVIATYGDKPTGNRPPPPEENPDRPGSRTSSNGPGDVGDYNPPPPGDDDIPF